MNYLQSVVLGVIEGATEYLPISSTFHLIWTSNILGIPQTEFVKAYEVIIQGGAILAVLTIYTKSLLQDKQILLKILTAFIPTAALGYALYGTIKGTFFESYELQLAIFALVGGFFLYFEKANRSLTRTLAQFSYKQALIIGLVQTLAVFPGVSRAGAVIIGMMFLGFKRPDAAKFSFYLAVPTLLAASGLDLFKSIPALSTEQGNMIGIIIVGFISSFISALAVVKWFTAYLEKNNLAIFGYYRIVMVILLYAMFA